MFQLNQTQPRCWLCDGIVCFVSGDLTSFRHAEHITPITHYGAGFVLSLHQSTSTFQTKLENFSITLLKHSLLSGLDPISFTVSML